MTSIAIIGAGPSGLFAADGLTRKLPDARIDIIERLPTPFGLVRAGVAPDHQGTKAIQRQFERTLDKDTVRLIGNVTIGSDVTLDDLRGLYDVVIFAAGAPIDRHLGIPGEDLTGVYGSADFVGWYNGHPDQANLAPALDGSGAVIIGNGNVALDVCRLLVKTADEMATSDVVPAAASALQAMPLTDVWLAGRRGATDAAFTFSELSELGELARCTPRVDAEQLPDAIPEGLPPGDARMKEKTLKTLQGFAASAEDKPITLHMAFQANPIEILGAERVEGVRFERTRVEDGRAVGTGETFDVPCGLVVTAIGYQTPALDGLPIERGVVVNNGGKIEDGLYVVGWAKRGPSGTVPTNRADSLSVVGEVIADLGDTAPSKAGGDGLDALLADRGVRTTSLEDWRTLDAAEQARATDDHPRDKFTTVDDMLNALS